MEINEYFKYRNELLQESQDETGFFSTTGFLQTVLPLMLDSKLIESEDYNESYYPFADSPLRLVGYSINESGERLILYLVNEDSIKEKDEELLKVTQKSSYDIHFTKAFRFVQSAIKGELTSELQDADGVNFLINNLASDRGLDDFDVVEMFLLTATATIETRGSIPQPKKIDFEDEFVKVKYKREKARLEKEIKVIKRIVDLNFLHSVLVSQGNRQPLVIDFEHSYNFKIEAIKAADERFFESYLCVIPATLLANLYRDHSSRLLEKNVRSFLQFSKKGVNAGIKETIKGAPEKFIAYNNGLTITATGKEIIEENGRQFLTSLTDFQIVNGGQTTATIFFSRKEGLDIEHVKVMAKINIAKESTEEELDELISNISTFSNAQNRVSKVDLKSRSKPMVRLKSLSDSIITPKGSKWFFERAKGELNTLIRKGSKEAILKKYPKERRFTKEELAKYYTAWGDMPFKVKRGGEKVFREFIEEISGEGKAKAPEIDRLFYENVIARIILFRGLEKLYAENKIGNLRAATIPYSISVLYTITDGASDDSFFNFEKIWIDEKIESDLSHFFLELMTLMNALIKKYATSDDPSENSKTKELWERINSSPEISAFISGPDTVKIKKNYTIGKDQYKARIAKYQKKEVGFTQIQENVFIQNNGAQFYQKLKDLFTGFTQREKENLNEIIDLVYKRKDLSLEKVEQEKAIIHKIINQAPELLDSFELQKENNYQQTLDLIIATYNSCILNKKNVAVEFKQLATGAENANIKNASVWNQIGEKLAQGEAPCFNDIYLAATYISQTKDTETKSIPLTKIDESLLKKMLDWAAAKKALSINEINYMTDFAYGLKKLTSFHEGNLRRYLDVLIKKGFK